MIGQKTKYHPKRKYALINALELIQFHWNFMDLLHDKMTPGMIESLSDHIWSWDDFLMYHYALLIGTLPENYLWYCIVIIFQYI